MTRILLFGQKGQLATELQRLLPRYGSVTVAGSDQIDLAHPDSFIPLIRSLRPNIIINSAAYTAVDKAESEQDLAHKINCEAPGVIATEAKSIGSRLIHYSTDFVFDGKSSSPYTEKQPTSPINIYGKTKREGEEAIQAVDADFLILRTSWVYSLVGHNFLKTMLRLAKEGKTLRVVNDQVGTPTWSRSLAEATGKLIELPDAKGIYHLSSEGETSWYLFTNTIFQLSNSEVNLEPITTAEYPTLAQRPKYSVLSNEKIRNELKIEMPHWREALEMCLSELNRS